MLEQNISCKNIYSNFMKCLVYYDKVNNNQKCKKVFEIYNQCIVELGDI